jgi:hypothetical protein
MGFRLNSWVSNPDRATFFLFSTKSYLASYSKGYLDILSQR